MTDLPVYVGKRLVRAVVMLWAVVSVVFIVFRVIPGDPSAMFAGGITSPEAKQAIMQRFGLTKPLHEQYIIYWTRLLNGDLGYSFFYSEPVWNVVIPKFLNTLALMIPSFLVMFVAAYFSGAYFGWNEGRFREVIASNLAVTFRALPHFVLGLFLLIVFSYTLGWFPIGGAGPIGDIGNTFLEKIQSPTFYWHAALPAATVIFHWFADPYLLMRGNIIDQREQHYIRLLRLKGLKEKDIRKHAARNSMLPMFTYLSTLVSIAFSGVVLVEVVFNWPGIGREIVLATFHNDYPVAQGAFLVIATAIVFANLVIDLVYLYIDPRIEY